MWYSAKKRAKRRDVPFSITPLDIAIPARCPVLGVKLAIGHGADGKGPSSCSPTLDCIDPSLGYVPGNIAVISWRANRLKSDATLAELRRLADWVEERLTLPREAVPTLDPQQPITRDEDR